MFKKLINALKLEFTGKPVYEGSAEELKDLKNKALVPFGNRPEPTSEHLFTLTCCNRHLNHRNVCDFYSTVKPKTLKESVRICKECGNVLQLAIVKVIYVYEWACTGRFVEHSKGRYFTYDWFKTPNPNVRFDKFWKES